MRMKRIPVRSILILAILLIAFGPAVFGDSTTTGVLSETIGHPGSEAAHGGHSEPVVVPVLFALIVVLVVAKIGGDLLERVHQPAVLGELVFGVIIGNLALVGIGGLEFLKTNTSIEVLAEIGVIILLFEVGLETNIKEMLSVGATSFVVATLGVITPFFLGWGVSAYFLPDEPIYAHIFIGATLCATSVGITARVLNDIKKVRSKEGQIILGAAVIDDIMGLVVLSVVTGLIATADSGSGGGVSSMTVFIVVAKALAFVVGALLIGSLVVPRILRFGLRIKATGVLLSIALAFCFLLAFLAEKIGLAAIVGAFAAGLIMDRVHYKDYVDRGEHGLQDLIHPIAIFLVPVFFVRMGLLVDLATFTDSSILLFALVLTIAAIVGKQACALGVWQKGINRIAVGLGMIPRGEVGLIFAKIGAAMTLAGVSIVTKSTYSAVVIMVMVTTLVTPPLLKVSLLREPKEPGRRRKAVGSKKEDVAS
jgi:Kef-type K+ transport system membrane component KefB